MAISVVTEHFSRTIAELMTRNIVCVPPFTSLSDCAGRMRGAGISSVVVSDGDKPLGILTERDILHALNLDTAQSVPVSSLMAHPVVSVAQDMDAQDAYHRMVLQRIRHLLVVDVRGRAVGLVSETDFRRRGGIEAFVGLKSVRSAMDTGVPMLDGGRSVAEAAALMDQRRASCVLVVGDGRTEGIVTERDMVRLYVQGGREKRLAEVMNAPLISISPDASLVEAARLMQEAGVRHLVVASPDGQTPGVLSEHDLVKHTEDGYVDLLQSVIRRQSEELLHQQKLIDLQQLREAVADTEFRYRHILEQMPQRVFVKDLDSRYLFCNGHFLAGLGRTAEQVVGKLDGELFSADMAARYREHDRQVLEAGETITIEELPSLIHGEKCWLRTSKTPLRDTGGHIVGLVGIAEDVTRARRLQQEIVSLNRNLEGRVSERTARLQSANRELAALSYTLSHDLRSPLRAINGYATLLRDSLQARLTGEEEEFLNRIRVNAVRMGELMDDVLAYSRVGGELKRQSVDLLALATEVVAERASLHPLAKVSVGTLPVVQADAAMMRQLFGNLLDNALKFSGRVPSPQVDVGMQTEDGQRVFHVRDNGVGFDPREAGRLFSIFERLHAGDYPGTGIGLTIVKRIVEQHGGRIWADSAPGMGATFYFTLGEGVAEAGMESPLAKGA